MPRRASALMQGNASPDLQRLASASKLAALQALHWQVALHLRTLRRRFSWDAWRRPLF